jgi:competence protein ComEC
MRGLKNLHEHIGITNFWDTDHTKPTPSYRSDADKADWEFYQKLRAGSTGTKVLRFTRGDAAYAFAREEDGRPGGDNIEILSPTSEFVKTCNKAAKSNDLSLVLRVKHASASVLLPGDVETAAWDDMVATYGANLKSSFLKASHHGRGSGYHLGALKLIDPLMTIVSVGNKPDTDASNKYRQVTGRRVPSTRYYGDIEIQIDDTGNYKWFVNRNADNS